ncbi:ABC transporter permease [Rhodobacteraceae bacterium 2376]|uniref:ABC transporter permease n=1 Tax=Rhabdonatronobacter sediminivivens TaxID=2743469 RepID=A0A7Z0I284_9RHOB|nr:ABC transporter permease [Rhabdonatronobacter sediminivivens]NYS26606.1 ABC transporter permease [Rhabdonatronobacter sediminivivens]
MTAASDPALQTGDNAAALRADELRERATLLGMSVPALLIVGVIVFIPVGWLFWLSFTDGDQLSLTHYRRIADITHARIFWQTFEISALVTVLALLLGYPLAYLMSQLSPRWAGICLIFVLVPFWTSLLVRTYAWMVLLQRRGLVNQTLMDLGIIDMPLRLVYNYTGTVIGMLHIMLPFMILPLYAALRTVDMNYMRAAANLGASPLRAFWTVFFPLSMPGVIAGSLLVFILSLGFYVTPALLGGGRVMMVSMKIQQDAGLYFDWGAASALGVALLVITLGIFWVLSRFMRIERLYGGR